MLAIKNSTITLFLAAMVVLFCASKCSQTVSEPKNKTEPETYWNLGDSAQYVGKQTCAQCHAGHAKTFAHTGMGMSFDTVSKTKSALKNHTVIYDEFQDYYYQPVWQNNQMWLQEFRLKNGDTIYKRSQKINFIIGSGQHTNSHLFSENGFVYQAPFTVYTQTGKVDFPPGFEGGNNSRFSRAIGLECMSCHNAMPTKFVAGSENKFDKIPNGIDCERCHGPGSLHVEKIQRGEITDTANAIDWSIVNPKKLSADLQFELCQRCHLQGNAVLAEGKSFLDFKPGMQLNEVMDVYLPRYENSDEKFIMASHADRLKLSECFKNADGKLNCTTCHNPHVSVKVTGSEVFNAACKSCHGNEQSHFDCTREIKDLAQNNCVQCHMPSSGSIDIPHVTVHDHFIRKPQEKLVGEMSESKFLGLKAINNKTPSARSRINAYLQQFERFEQNPIFLDSAEFLLQQQPDSAFGAEWIHLFYLENSPSDIVKWVETHGNTKTWVNSLKERSLSNKDAWTAYRIAEAYRKFTDYLVALQFADKAVELAPNNMEFRLKQNSILALMKDYKSAEKGYKYVLQQNALLTEAWSDLGFVQLALNKPGEAEKSIKKSLALNPDYVQAKVNLASVYLAQNNFAEARKWLEDVLTHDPENKRVKATLEYLNENNL